MLSICDSAVDYITFTVVIRNYVWIDAFINDHINLHTVDSLCTVTFRKSGVMSEYLS